MRHPTLATPNVTTPLSGEALAELRSFSSPTIANAVESFGVRPRDSGCTNDTIRCLFPEQGAVVGYACTAAIISGEPAPACRLASRSAYWEYVRAVTGPKLIVVEDLSDQPGGAYWGEVNSNIHLALGALGVLTNGTVRDLSEVQRLGFQFFATGVSISHGYAHLEQFNLPVSVCEMTVQPGDLIHADHHGAVVIPHEIAPFVACAAREIERAERVIIHLCQSPGFSIPELDKLVAADY